MGKKLRSEPSSMDEASFNLIRKEEKMRPDNKNLCADSPLGSAFLGTKHAIIEAEYARRPELLCDFLNYDGTSQAMTPLN